jgi:tetratricopeptide (TPR) repeat protein
VLTPEQKMAKIAASLAQGDEALARKDYQAAIMAYNEVVRLDPQDATVRAKLLAVGEEYKKSRTDLEKLEKARTLFAGGEYESALRLIYRLPEGLLPPEQIDRYKVTGWYNLGVVALRGANCTDAVLHLTEAQALAPDDPDVRAARELADRCESMSSDRAFYNRADGLPFRKLDPPSR